MRPPLQVCHQSTLFSLHGGSQLSRPGIEIDPQPLLWPLSGSASALLLPVGLEWNHRAGADGLAPRAGSAGFGIAVRDGFETIGAILRNTRSR